MPECNEDGLGFTVEDEIAENEFSVESEFPVSGEPELIATFPDTPDEPSLFQAVPEPTPPEESHIASTVCEVCLELNLTHKDQVIKCTRCEQAFCFHYASNIDAQYCVNCLSDMSVEKSTISKEYIHKDENNNITSVYRRRAREIKINGLDWLFAQRKIATLSDVELDMSIEYHRNIMHLMIDEQERRRNAKMHRYAGVRVVMPTPGATTVTDTTHTTVKKTRTVSKSRQQEQLNAILSTVASKKGLDMEAVLKILKGV